MRPRYQSLAHSHAGRRIGHCAGAVIDEPRHMVRRNADGLTAADHADVGLEVLWAYTSPPALKLICRTIGLIATGREAPGQAVNGRN